MSLPSKNEWPLFPSLPPPSLSLPLSLTLARSRLSVAEECAVVPVQHRVDDRLRAVVEDELLLRARRVHAVEGERLERLAVRLLDANWRREEMRGTEGEGGGGGETTKKKSKQTQPFGSQATKKPPPPPPAAVVVVVVCV